MYYSGSYSPCRRSRNLDMHAGSLITIILIRQTSYRDLMSHIPPQMSAIASANHQNPGGSTSARMISTPARMTRQPSLFPLFRLRHMKKPPPAHRCSVTLHYMREAVFMLLFPFAVLGGDLVEPRIALVAAGVYLALVHGLADGAAGLLEVGAVVKAAMAYVGLELRKAVLQLLLGYRRQLLHVEGGEARRRISRRGA